MKKLSLRRALKAYKPRNQRVRKKRLLRNVTKVWKRTRVHQPKPADKVAAARRAAELEASRLYPDLIELSTAAHYLSFLTEHAQEFNALPINVTLSFEQDMETLSEEVVIEEIEEALIKLASSEHASKFRKAIDILRRAVEEKLAKVCSTPRALADHLQEVPVGPHLSTSFLKLRLKKDVLNYLAHHPKEQDRLFSAVMDYFIDEPRTYDYSLFAEWTSADDDPYWNNLGPSFMAKLFATDPAKFIAHIKWQPHLLDRDQGAIWKACWQQNPNSLLKALQDDWNEHKGADFPGALVEQGRFNRHWPISLLKADKARFLAYYHSHPQFQAALAELFATDPTWDGLKEMIEQETKK